MPTTLHVSVRAIASPSRESQPGGWAQHALKDYSFSIQGNGSKKNMKKEQPDYLLAVEGPPP